MAAPAPSDGAWLLMMSASLVFFWLFKRDGVSLETAVDADELAGDRARLASGEEQDHCRDLLGLDELAGRLSPQIIVLRFLDRDLVGLGIAGDDAVDPLASHST